MWHDDICEYYNVTPRTALELGTRSKGRKPVFPSSKTCPNPPKGLSFEEIWDSKPRDTIQQKMDFYKDLGPWQVFRQTVYRMRNTWHQYLPYITKDNAVVLEYGCGISHLINYLAGYFNYKFILVDVAGEHMEYAKWRLKRKAPEAYFEFHEITEDYIIPEFKCKIDFTMIEDVLEHVPNPHDVLKNIADNSNKNSIISETWIDQSDSYGYADLKESVDDRTRAMTILDNRYTKIDFIQPNINIRKLI